MDNASRCIREEDYQNDDSTLTAGYVTLEYALKLLRQGWYKSIFWGVIIGICLWGITRLLV